MVLVGGFSGGDRREILRRRLAERATKHRSERARAVVADVVGDRRDGLADGEPRQGFHQPDILPPGGETDARLAAESTRELIAEHTDTFVEATTAAEYLKKLD